MPLSFFSLCLCMNLCMYVGTCMCVLCEIMQVPVSVYMYVCMYVCMYACIAV